MNKDDIRYPAHLVERMARIIHEAGRIPVEQGKVYRNELPMKPFCEYDELGEPAKEGRRMMAEYVLYHPGLRIAFEDP